MRFLTYAPIRPIRAAAATLVALMTLSGAALPAFAQGQTIGTYGDWRISCDTPPGAQNQQCALAQEVVADDRANVGINLFVLRTADGAATLLRVLVPLGVILPAGLGLIVDEAEIGTADFVRCFYPEGCMAEVLVTEELLAQLTAGTTATFVLSFTPEEAIGVPVSLNGFGDAFAALP